MTPAMPMITTRPVAVKTEFARTMTLSWNSPKRPTNATVITDWLKTTTCWIARGPDS